MHTPINFHFKQPGENLTSAPYSNNVARIAKALAPLSAKAAGPDLSAQPCRSAQVTWVHQLLTEPASLSWDLSSSLTLG